MELYQRGIINNTQTGGLDLQWGDYPLIERLLFMTARRQGFGDILANSARAIERGNYPEKASDYLMAAKGLFQSDPHDSRILKAFALGLAVATRGMDHLRNRVTLEINARINDDEEFKTTLYGGKVAAEPNAYEGKENAVFRCETTYAAGDSVGMCRFNTKLFNSPSLPDCDDFAHQLHEITGIAITDAEVQECGHNVTGLEHMINFRLGLRSVDDTLPNRWFDEQNTFGPFKGEYIDRGEFLAMKKRYYQLVGLNDESLPQSEWHRQLSQATTGFSIDVILPTSTPGAPESRCIIDEPVSNVYELRQALARRLPEAVDVLSDRTLGFTINDEPLLHSEKQCPVQNGDRVILVPVMAGG